MEFLGISLWAWWVGSAFLFFILEIILPGFWVATLGIGALAGAMAALFVGNFNIQLLVFAIVSGISFIFVRPVVTKYLYQGRKELKSNADALAGQKVKVLETIDNINEKGRIKIGADHWIARTIDNSIALEGEIVEIVRVDSAKVIVKKIGG